MHFFATFLLSFCFFFAILYLYPLEFTYNRQPALMIPGFSGLPVLYLYFFRLLVFEIKYDDDDNDDDDNWYFLYTFSECQKLL